MFAQNLYAAMPEINHKQNLIFFPNLIKNMHPDGAEGAFAC
jgi:hypothetical protein